MPPSVVSLAPPRLATQGNNCIFVVVAIHKETVSNYLYLWFQVFESMEANLQLHSVMTRMPNWNKINYSLSSPYSYITTGCACPRVAMTPCFRVWSNSLKLNWKTWAPPRVKIFVWLHLLGLLLDRLMSGTPKPWARTVLCALWSIGGNGDHLLILPCNYCTWQGSNPNSHKKSVCFATSTCYNQMFDNFLGCCKQVKDRYTNSLCLVSMQLHYYSALLMTNVCVQHIS